MLQSFPMAASCPFSSWLTCKFFNLVKKPLGTLSSLFSLMPFCPPLNSFTFISSPTIKPSLVVLVPLSEFHSLIIGPLLEPRHPIQLLHFILHRPLLLPLSKLQKLPLHVLLQKIAMPTGFKTILRLQIFTLWFIIQIFHSTTLYLLIQRPLTLMIHMLGLRASMMEQLTSITLLLLFPCSLLILSLTFFFQNP
jgi:hypothetical protein